MRVKDDNGLLQLAQVEALNNPTSANFLEEKRLMDKWEFLRSIEESYFRQRSKIIWLREGDLNTTFFHRLTQVRNSLNSIRSFRLPSGEIISDPLVMGAMAIAHFQHLLSPSSSHTIPISREWIRSLTSYSCPTVIASFMVCLPTPETIQQILFKLNANKSPGPDGLTSRFYKAAWPIVGAEVIRDIQMFSMTGRLPYSTNSKILTLVLKHSGASSISDYRPISCCNTLYKVIQNSCEAPQANLANSNPAKPNIICTREITCGKYHSYLWDCPWISHRKRSKKDYHQSWHCQSFWHNQLGLHLQLSEWHQHPSALYPVVTRLCHLPKFHDWLQWISSRLLPELKRS